jgi:hypothetical protein
MNELLSLAVFFSFLSLRAYTKLSTSYLRVSLFVVSDYESFVQAAIHKLLFMKLLISELLRKKHLSNVNVNDMEPPSKLSVHLVQL